MQVDSWYGWDMCTDFSTSIWTIIYCIKFQNKDIATFIESKGIETSRKFIYWRKMSIVSHGWLNFFAIVEVESEEGKSLKIEGKGLIKWKSWQTRNSGWTFQPWNSYFYNTV